MPICRHGAPHILCRFAWDRFSMVHAAAHPRSVPNAVAMVLRLTDTKGAVYWISALLRTCARTP